MTYFQNKTYLITGASRGIGKAIGLKLASQGANIIIAAKSIVEHPKLEGTIYSAAKEMEEIGGQALAVQCDVREESMIVNAIEKGIAKFGRLDGIINNASAISLTNTEKTDTKRYDLMMDINVRGAFLVVKNSLSYLKKSENPHILNLSPPLNFNPKWMAGNIAYTISKYNMTMLALGWASEFQEFGIAANSLWPMTTIATAAVQNLLGGEQLMARSRKPEILSDTVHFILQQDARQYTGQQLLDEDVLKNAGIHNFDHYAFQPGHSLQKDLFLD